MALRVILEPRREPARWHYFAAPAAAVAVTLLAGALLFSLLGFDPAEALTVYFISPLQSGYDLGELLVKASPLLLIAIGLSIGFRAGIWNIGAEGQLVVGAVAGTAVALALPETLGAWLAFPLILVGGVAGGALWAAAPAFLKTRYGTNEILTSLMLVYVAGLLLSALVHGPLRDPLGYNFPQSSELHDAALAPIIWPGTRLHIGIVIAAAVAAGAWWALHSTLFGYQVTVLGLAPRAAGHAGFSAKRITWAVLLLSGGLAGLAGVLEVAGPIGRLTPTVSPGYGFTAIIVAFLGRLHPIGIVAASLLIALSFLGGELAQVLLKMPSAVTQLFQGILLFALLACEFIVRFRIRLLREDPAAAA